MQLQLHTIDLSIIVVYFLGVLWLGWKLSRRELKSEDSYFVAGRQLGWVAIGASLFASNISSEHLIGLAADGFRTGLAVGNYEWGATVALILLATVFVPFYIGAKVRTMPEFLEKRFGVSARIYLSTITIVANVLVRISPALFAGTMVLESLLGFDRWTAMLLMSVATVFYTALGGLAAVVYTDVVQAVILLIGTSILSYNALDAVGGWAALRAGLDASMFDMVRPADDPEMPWVGLVLGVPVLGVWYWCTDQTIVQRVLGAKDVHNARMGAMLAAGLKILPVFLFVLPGLCGRLLYPDLDNPNLVFPTLLGDLLPTGLLGLVAAGLIAALMSSIDSTLNSTATLVSIDFVQRFRPNTSAASLIKIGRWTTVVVMIFGVAWVMVVERAESLFQYLQQVNAAISPPIAAAFIVGVFWPRANSRGAMFALVGGLLTGLVLMVLEPFPFLITAAITFGSSIMLLVAGSLSAPAPLAEQVEGLTWSRVERALSQQPPHYQRLIFRLSTASACVTMACLWTHFA